jgi:hypothetical protein
MTNTEIKKALYREKPMATRYNKTVTNYYYVANLKSGFKVYFTVPTKDMGELPFGETEQAQLLIRYL